MSKHNTVRNQTLFRRDVFLSGHLGVPAGNTLSILGLQLESDDAGPKLHRVPRSAILQDIQFRGAISDFHPLKAVLLTADYDPLILRTNPDDIYCDGNNIEVRSQ